MDNTNLHNILEPQHVLPTAAHTQAKTLYLAENMRNSESRKLLGNDQTARS